MLLFPMWLNIFRLLTTGLNFGGTITKIWKRQRNESRRRLVKEYVFFVDQYKELISLRWLCLSTTVLRKYDQLRNSKKGRIYRFSQLYFVTLPLAHCVRIKPISYKKDFYFYKNSPHFLPLSLIGKEAKMLYFRARLHEWRRKGWLDVAFVATLVLQMAFPYIVSTFFSRKYGEEGKEEKNFRFDRRKCEKRFMKLTRVLLTKVRG